MKQTALLVFLALSCGEGTESSETDAASTDTRRNVLLIIADDLGVDKVSVYAADEADYYADSTDSLPSTPNIDALAAAGVRFTQAWSNPVCSPTRAGAYTGRHAFRTGIGEVVSASASSPYLALTETTIAEAIAGSIPARRVNAGIFGKWHIGSEGNGTLTDDAPRVQGFATHQGTLSGVLSSYWSWTKYEDGVEMGEVTDYATEDVASDASDWINSQSRPWLAIAAFNAPHRTSRSVSYEVPPSGCGAYTIDSTITDQALRYRAVVECLDAQIGSMLAAIPSDVLANTTIFFIGDNGTEEAVARGIFADGTGGKGTVYQNGVRVPFIAADGYTYSTGSARTSASVAGQILSPDRTVDDPVHTTDLFATIVRIEGSLNATGVDSVSLLPYLRSTSAAPQHETVYTEQFESGSGTAAIRNDQWKLIANVAYPDPTSDCAADFSYEVTGFYNLENDPHELDDLLGDSSADMTEYDALYDAMTDMHQTWLAEVRTDAGCP